MQCPHCRAENDPEAESCFTCGWALAAPIRRGSVLASRYEILSPLGKGGMGMVYEARDRVLGENVAVKLLRPELSRRPEMIRRFRAEMAFAQKLRHPNLCRIYACGEEGGRLWVCMERVEGKDLRTLVRGTKGLAPERAFEVVLQVAAGLQALHGAGIVHRDVKSANVMVDGKGAAKLMDFDIAKQWQAEGAEAATATGQTLGTPEYMSPEYARGERVDFRSDVYSLGVVAFEAFTGQVPFRGDTPLATMLKQVREPPPLEGPRAAGLPPALVPVLKKALAKDVAGRYSTVRGLAAALRLARTAGGELALPPPREPEPLPALLGALNPIDKTVRLEVPRKKADPKAGKAIPVLIEALDEAKAPGREHTATPAEAQEAEGATPQEPIAVLVEALRSDDTQGRARAARVLGGIGPAAQEAIPVLLEALRDREATVRYDAARALERMGSAAQEALAAAVKDPDEVVRRIAAEALARILKRKRERRPS